MSNSDKSKARRRRRRILVGALALIVVAAGVMAMGGSSRASINMTANPVNIQLVENDDTTVAMVQSEVAKAEDLTEEDVRDLVREAVALAGGLESIVEDGDTVVLKPNMMSTNHSAGGMRTMMAAQPTAENPIPETSLMSPTVNGLSTDYRVTKAVAELVRELNPNGKIYVMEASGSGFTAEKYEAFGYTHEEIPYVDEFISMDASGAGYTEEAGAEDLVAVDLGEYKRYEDRDGLSHMSGIHYIDRTYYEADVLISLPVLKNHQMAAVTGAIKNVAIGSTPPVLYGDNPDEPTSRFAINHFWDPLQQFIHDYYLVKPIDFVVTDGLQSMENGPVGMGADDYNSLLKNKRVILAGEDAVAVDTIHALVTGVDPEKVDYFQMLAEDGVGITDTAFINLVGNIQMDDVNERYSFPGFPYSRVQPVPRTTIYEDFEAPVANLDDAALEAGKVTASVSADEDIIKAEISIDGVVVEVVRTTGTEVSVDVSNDAITEDSSVTITVYDRFLNGTDLEVK